LLNRLGAFRTAKKEGPAMMPALPSR
jgi:hypothetical protein